MRLAWEGWLLDAFGDAIPGALVMVTWTFRNTGGSKTGLPARPPSVTRVRRALRELEELQKRSGLRWVTVVEHGSENDRLHLHSLVKVPADGLGLLAISQMQGWWELREGFTRLSRVESPQGTATYLVKYVAKGTEEGWPIVMSLPTDSVGNGSKVYELGA